MWAMCAARAGSTQTRNTDQASGALIQDLKQRGLLDDTLVVWGGEFGCTAYSQGDISPNSFGRDHQSFARREAPGRRGSFRAAREGRGRSLIKRAPDRSRSAGGRSGNGAEEGNPILDEGHPQRCRLSDRTVPPLQRSSVHRLVGHDSALIAVRKSFAIGGTPLDTFKILLNYLPRLIKP